MQIQERVDLAPYNSFRVHATADWFARTANLQDLRRALDFAAARQLPVQILGGGSNLLFSRDFPGLVLLMDWRGIELPGRPGLVRAAGGENWHQLVVKCMKKNLYGIENNALIPGTVGAAPIQNIGAFGIELAQFLVEVEVFDRQSGKLRCFDRAACGFAYRDSVFKRSGPDRFVVLRMTLQLRTRWKPQLDYAALRDFLKARGQLDSPSPRQVFDAICSIRRSRLPDPAELGNAGSFFRNPVVSSRKFAAMREEMPELPGYPTEQGEIKIPAGWLLDRMGWKGRAFGKAAVYDKHALVLVNTGGASGADIVALAQQISASVQERFAISLEPEVQIV